MGLCLPLLGCPPGTCFIKTCVNGVCKCPVNSCAEGADFDLNVNACVCKPGLFTVQGQCLDKGAADKFCGKGSEWGQQGCVAKACPAGQQLDVGSGECKDSRALATALGVELKKGETIGCPAGQKLVTEGDKAACVPLAQTCSPDEHWDGRSCVKAKSCGSGSVFDPDSGECVAFGTAESNSFSVNTQSWAAANYGKDGGNATVKFCGAFARRPWTFGIGEGQSAMVNVNVQLAFAGGKVSGGEVNTKASFANSGAAVPKAGADGVQDAAENILATLKAGGGEASPTRVTLTVRCPVASAAKPVVVPASGGL